MGAKILIIDDEPGLAEAVAIHLRREGYRIRTATDGPEGLKATRSFQPDLLILDIMMPQMDGLALLRRLRQHSDAYVIMLTARSEEKDLVTSLSMGADDYLTKPFSPRELVARVKAGLRRLQSGRATRQAGKRTFRHLRIDSNRREVWLDGKLIELTALEFELISVLTANHSLVMSRQELLEQVWGENYFGTDRVVDVHIGNIRRKFGRRRLIVTVRGVGYRFDDEVM